jgi:cAMP phosphodiesterase
LAVDAGTHLAAIARILEPDLVDGHTKYLRCPITMTAGPFRGLQLPYESVDANAAHITRYLVDTFLITHPHLDHISGFVVNTAGLPNTRPKRLAALPTTIAAFKDHIFNNIIWPNLSDENNGAGLVTYMRLVDGGSPAIGEGDSKGYVEICEGLSAKAFSISHGHCMENHTHRGSGSGLNAHEYSPDYDVSSKRSYSDLVNNGRSGIPQEQYDRRGNDDGRCVINSSAYFIRDIVTGHEVLILGDVEPDSISLSPRNLEVWKHAAPKIISGLLTTLLIECSYSDSQTTDQLYGHLAPRFLFEEMRALANCVDAARHGDLDKKAINRKRPSSEISKDYSLAPRRSPRVSTSGLNSPELRRQGRPPRQGSHSAIRSHSRHFELDDSVAESPICPSSPISWSVPPASLAPIGRTPLEEGVTSSSDLGYTKTKLPLKGFKVVIIHVKDKLDDGKLPGDVILGELRAYEEEEGLGVEFVLAEVGMALYA